MSIIVQYTNPEPQAEVKEEGEHGKPADAKGKVEVTGRGKSTAEGHGKKEAEAKADAQAKPETTAKPEAKGKDEAEVKKPEPAQVKHAAPPAKAEEARYEAEKDEEEETRRRKIRALWRIWVTGTSWLVLMEHPHHFLLVALQIAERHAVEHMFDHRLQGLPDGP